jgi:uncharacterized RDD family membrane protein YckC
MAVTQIEIVTAQNVTIEYPLAILRERFLALLLDLIVTMVLTYALVLLILSLLGISRFVGMFASLSPVLIFCSYNLLCEALLNGQSLGKKALRIRVVRPDGAAPSLSDLLMRSVLQLMDFFLSFGVVGAVLITSSVRRQRLGDMAAGTVVVRIEPSHVFRLQDIQKIDTQQNYTPKYPQVRQLSEADMLSIKNALARYEKYPNQAHTDVLITLTTHLCQLLNIEKIPSEKNTFLRTLIKDYIVLTR